MFERYKWKQAIGVFVICLGVWMAIQYFQLQHLKQLGIWVLNQPLLLVTIFSLYFSAFVLRAYAWYEYVNRTISFRYCLSGIFYSMFFNHILPFKGGDVIRIGVATVEPNRTSKVSEIVHSVIILRLIDIGILFLFTSIGFFVWIGNTPVPVNGNAPFIGGIVLAALFLLTSKRFRKIAQRQWALLSVSLRGKKGFFIIFLIFLSWILEASVVYTFIRFQPYHLTFIEAIWVNSLTVGGQFFQITPGGIASYEAFMTFGLRAFHIPFSDALSVSIMTHLFKFIFSFFVGYLAFMLVPLNRSTIKEFLQQTKSVGRGDSS